MDQVKKLYYELVSYEPSLVEQKDKVFEVIKKMLDAKPIVNLNMKWKDQFANRLHEYISQSKLFAPAPIHRAPFISWLTKWSYAITTFLIGIVIVGATFWAYQSKTTIENQYAGYSKSELIARKGSVVSPFKQAMEARLAANSGSKNSGENNVLLTMSTEVDNSGISANADISGDMNGPVAAVATLSSTYDSKENTGGASMNADETTRSKMPATMQMAEEKVVSLIFIDTRGSVMQSDILATLESNHIPATFLESDDAISLKLQSAGYEIRTNISTVSYVDMRVDSEKSIDVLAKNKEAILFHVDELIKDSSLLKRTIEKLQAQGYVFVTLSTFTQ